MEYPLSEDRETDQVLSKRRSGMVGLVQGFCQRKEAAISIPSWHLFFLPDFNSSTYLILHAYLNSDGKILKQRSRTRTQSSKDV